MRIFILVVYARVVKVRDIAFPFYHQGILFRNPIQRHTSTSGIQISKYKRENKESNSYYDFEALCQVFIKEEKWLEKTHVFLYRVTQTMMSKLLLCLRRGVERCMGWGVEGSTSSARFCNEGAVKAGIASRRHFPTLLPPWQVDILHAPPQIQDQWTNKCF